MAFWYRELVVHLGMPPMNARCLSAAVAAVALCGLSLPAPAADPGLPRRTIDERPFGGPPPQRRSMDGKAWSTSCKTPSLTCKLEKARQVGSACSCPGSDGKEAAGVIELPK
jgi:hypothetical protein